MSQHVVCACVRLSMCAYVHNIPQNNIEKASKQVLMGHSVGAKPCRDLFYEAALT